MKQEKDILFFIRKVQVERKHIFVHMRKLKSEELERKSPAEFHQSAKIPLVIVLDNVRSLLNVGSVFRTADAFLVEAIYLCGITGTPPHREIQKTALGAVETVSWKYFSSAMDVVNELKRAGYNVFAVEQAEGSVSLEQFLLRRKMAVVFGNEVSGVQQEVVNACDGAIEIPQLGTKHSLNIAVSAGVVVWEIFRKLHAVTPRI